MLSISYTVFTQFFRFIGKYRSYVPYKNVTSASKAFKYSSAPSASNKIPKKLVRQENIELADMYDTYRDGASSATTKYKKSPTSTKIRPLLANSQSLENIICNEKNIIQIYQKQRIESSSALSLVNCKTSLNNEFEYDIAFQNSIEKKMHSKILKNGKVLALDLAKQDFKERRGCTYGTGKIILNEYYPYFK